MVPLAVALLRWLRGRRALPLVVAAAALLCWLRLRRRRRPLPLAPAPAAAAGAERTPRVTFAPRPVVSDSVGPYVPRAVAVAATATRRTRKSAQQCWRNAVLGLPTGQVLRVVTEREAAASDPHVRAQSQSDHDTELAQVDLLPEGGQQADGDEGDAGELIEGMAAGSWSGGSIWESTEFLAQLLCEMPSDSWETARVLELGAGCGLLGLAAAGLGAELVVLSDHVRSPPHLCRPDGVGGVDKGCMGAVCR